MYLDAIRSLRVTQLIGRARRLIPPRVLAARLAIATSPEWLPVARGLARVSAPQCGDVPAPHKTGAFEAYGTRRSFSSPSFWTDSGDGLLYLFYLHGFEALAVYAARLGTVEGDQFWQAVVESWFVCESRPRHPSWHPYPTSQRLIAWSTALSGLDRWPSDFQRRLAAEIHRQARYLRRTVERDIGGNHVLKNATALCFAGAVVSESDVLDAGLRLLRRECACQFLADGGHEERSTSYHRQALADLEDVVTLLDRLDHRCPPWLSDTIARADRWQRALVGPDGSLPLLGDAWEGPSLEERLTEPVTVLGDTGYVALRHQQDQLVVDVGTLCPPHLPPHAHADCLSFILWADGHPVIVDPGSFTYAGPERDAFRGVRAHNTIQVEDRDQCLFWGPFRAAFLPDVTGPLISRHGDVDLVEGSHDGYSRGNDRIVHLRSFIWWPSVGLVVIDRIEAGRPVRISSRLCLAPDVPTEFPGSAGPFQFATLGRTGVTAFQPRDYSPALGSKLRSTGILQELTAAPLEPFGWSLLREGASAEIVDDQSVLLRSASGDEQTVPLRPLG